ncbi:MAG: hypothetical protein HQL09_09755 [Nitrospirae bacterium]|nr:hypothetical protein [Nitrospirota bacterium]
MTHNSIIHKAISMLLIALFIYTFEAFLQHEVMAAGAALAAIQEGASKTVVIVERHGTGGDAVFARTVGGQDRQEILPPTLGTGGLAVGGSYPDGPLAVSAVQSAVFGQTSGYAAAVAQYLHKYGYSAASVHYYTLLMGMTPIAAIRSCEG